MGDNTIDAKINRSSASGNVGDVAGAAGAEFPAMPAEQWAPRVDLAATFRWFARLDMHESVANHMSVAVSAGRFAVSDQPRAGGISAASPRASCCC